MESRETNKTKRYSQAKKPKDTIGKTQLQFGDRLAVSMDKDGTRKLYMELPVTSDKVQLLDLSPWLAFPDLYPAIADGAIAAGSGSRYRTRDMRYQTLTRGFFTFLKSIPPSVTIVVRSVKSDLGGAGVPNGRLQQ